ncbi:hypothetical protein BDB00DRAFT_805145 [Zychaea mexicana]|uniref:uncharacterized protein n=1 Tax=Zychaea mexicana TaxID=64656 RepID=UPI0022FF3FFF|nr:uncharacterized protein BDB00DRAFT_805145 [Zychaea mexicana]KAI9497143.1 hypothetical protein BDB00DRAFT_805145 [Zychaea mexicana]
MANHWDHARKSSRPWYQSTDTYCQRQMQDQQQEQPQTIADPNEEVQGVPWYFDSESAYPGQDPQYQQVQQGLKQQQQHQHAQHQHYQHYYLDPAHADYHQSYAIYWQQQQQQRDYQQYQPDLDQYHYYHHNQTPASGIAEHSSHYAGAPSEYYGTSTTAIPLPVQQSAPVQMTTGHLTTDTERRAQQQTMEMICKNEEPAFNTPPINIEKKNGKSIETASFQGLELEQEPPGPIVVISSDDEDDEEEESDDDRIITVSSSEEEDDEDAASIMMVIDDDEEEEEVYDTDFDFDDSSSIDSYVTASETPFTNSIDTQCIAIVNELPLGRHFTKLQEEHGLAPGVSQLDGEIEEHSIPFAPESNSLFKNEERRLRATNTIKRFSNADIHITRARNNFIFNTTGTLGQVYFSIKAADALLQDHIRLSVYYVLLRVDGPQFAECIKKLHQVIEPLAPGSKYITPIEDLHITVGATHVRNEEARERLISVVESAAKEFEAALEKRLFVGRLNALSNCNRRYLGLASKEISPLHIARSVFREKLQDAGIAINRATQLHMTLYSVPPKIWPLLPSEYNLSPKTFKKELKKQEMALDVGPLSFTQIEVTRRNVTLSRGSVHHPEYIYRF